MKIVASCVFVVAFLCIVTDGASICKPYSAFRVDCNTCTCSKTGREYLCTQDICETVPYEDKFEIGETADGHILLKPKKTDPYWFGDNNDGFVQTSRKNRKPRLPEGYPFINDEIPPSEEDNNNIDNDIEYDVDNDIDNNDADVEETKNSDEARDFVEDEDDWQRL